MAEEFEPTPAEKLMAYRRRSGKTQAQLAQELGLPLHLYGDIERGKMQMDRGLTPLVNIELTVPEKLTALRRRLGISQRIAAAEMGVCRMTAAAMEEGRTDAAPLAALLNKRSEECKVTLGPQ
jgi:DNA-binding XRE family transcriptional regulator